MKKIFSILLLFFSIIAIANQDSTKNNMKVIIHTPTKSLQESIDFYKNLEYKILSGDNPTHLTDGKAIIEINPDRYARAGVKIYKESWTNEIERLSELTTVLKIEGGHLLNDFNGCWIYLIEGNLGYEEKLPDSSTAVPGNFMGISLESANMSKSLDIWTILGFSITMGSVEKGFLIIQNQEGFSVSMMQPLTCPHLFFNPSMTFFNGKNNLAVIDKIRKLNIPIAEEITQFNKEGIVDNIIIRDPGGYGFFIFND